MREDQFTCTFAMVYYGNQKVRVRGSNDSRLKKQELELMEALRVLITRDDSAESWAKRKMPFVLLGSWWIASPFMCWDNV